MVTGPAGIITSARSGQPGRRHSTQRRATMLPCSPARMLLITLASLAFSRSCSHSCDRGVPTAPVGLETPPISAKTMPMLTVRLIGVPCPVASPHPARTGTICATSLSHG